MSCVYEKIANNIGWDCTKPPVAGIYDEVVVINKDDIDYSVSQVDTQNLTITDLRLKTGKTGYKVSGIKNMHGISFERAEGTFGAYYKHKYTGVLLNQDKEARAELMRLLNGEVVIVARRKYKGTAQFVVLGWEYGLKGSAHNLDSNANSGAETFELATPEMENAGEPLSPYTLLEGDIDTTVTAFENAFAS